MSRMNSTEQIIPDEELESSTKSTYKIHFFKDVYKQHMIVKLSKSVNGPPTSNEGKATDFP